VHADEIITNRVLIDNTSTRVSVNEERLDNHYMRIENNSYNIAENSYRLDVHANAIMGNYTRIEDTNARIDLLADDVASNTNRINSLEGNLAYLTDEMYSGMSAVSAMGAIPDAPVGRTAIGVGYGNFGGQNAAALGMSHRSETGRHAFTLSGTFTQRENGVAAGYSFSF
jgi:autotransporter adhesin